MIDVVDTPLPGVRVLAPRVWQDERGEFVKVFQAELFAGLGIQFAPVEEFFSSSRRNVIRGMHFQRPPFDHDKLVYCIEGSVLDVVLDLRRGSPDFGKAKSVELSGENRKVLFVPRGVAHGFLATEDSCVMVYLTSTVHSPSHDSGVRWDSFGFDWGTDRPIVSERDASLPPLSLDDSPFP